jgi:hypothetical protein
MHRHLAAPATRSRWPFGQPGQSGLRRAAKAVSLARMATLGESTGAAVVVLRSARVQQTAYLRAPILEASDTPASSMVLSPR